MVCLWNNSWCCFEKCYLISNNVKIFHRGQNTKGILETISQYREEMVSLTTLQLLLAWLRKSGGVERVQIKALWFYFASEIKENVMGRLWRIFVSIDICHGFGRDDFVFFGISSKHHLKPKEVHSKQIQGFWVGLLFELQHSPKLTKKTKRPVTAWSGKLQFCGLLMLA